MDDLNNLLTIVVPVKNEERNLPGCLIVKVSGPSV